MYKTAKEIVYEPFTGESHVLEAFRFEGHYIVMVDGAFYASCENMREVDEEFEDMIRWFGWTTNDPVYA